MNEQDYGSREACQRLFEKGIVVETEKYHCRLHDWEPYELKNADYAAFCDDSYPALSLAEAWRMLPEVIEEKTITYYRTLIMGAHAGQSYAGYFNLIKRLWLGEVFGKENPTDALIDLLIDLLIHIKELENMKIHYFNQPEPDKDDMPLQMAKEQGYVPKNCLLGGQIVMRLVNSGEDPCKGCNCPREKCNGRKP